LLCVDKHDHIFELKLLPVFQYALGQHFNLSISHLLVKTLLHATLIRTGKPGLKSITIVQNMFVCLTFRLNRPTVTWRYARRPITVPLIILWRSCIRDQLCIMWYAQTHSAS